MSPRIAGAGVILAAAALLLTGAASGPLMDPDEARFGRTSVEMLRSGDQIVPHFEGRPRLAKPPLVHWVQSALFRWTGPVEWACRFPAALSVLGSVLLASWVCRRRFGPEGGVWAGAVLATMPLVLISGRVGTIDALLAVHVFAAVALDMVDPEGGGPRRAACVGGLLGLAFLAKGPVGPILALIAMLAGRTALRRETLPAIPSVLVGAVAWGAVVLPWGLGLVRRVGLRSVWDTLREEALESYFHGAAHVRPAWYYAAALAAGFLPWSGALAVGLARNIPWPRRPPAGAAGYAAAGLLAGVAFLSLGSNKLPTYALPLAPLAAVVVVSELRRELDAPGSLLLTSTVTAVTVSTCAALLGWAAFAKLSGATRELALAGAVLLGVGAAVACWAAVRRRPRVVYAAAAGGSASFLMWAIVAWFPGFAADRSAAGLVERWPELRRADRAIVLVAVRAPSLTFYADRIPEAVAMEDLNARIEEPDAPWVILARVDLPDVPPAADGRLEALGSSGKFEIFIERDRISESTNPSE